MKYIENNLENGDIMDFITYKEIITNRLSNSFDIEENYVYKNFKFDLFGTLNIRNEKYMASKKLTIYAFENDEYCFLKYFDVLDENIIDDLIKILKLSINDYVKPHHEHMCSVITGVIVVDNFDNKNLIKKIKKFNYQKGFMFGLKGWADVRLILVDLQNNKVITSKKAKRVGKFYQPLNK